MGVQGLDVEVSVQRPSRGVGMRHSAGRLLRLLLRDKIATIAALFLLGITGVAIFAQYVAPHDPLLQAIPDRLQPPAWVEGGSPGHILGSDQLGRDTLSRVIYASQISMFVGWVVVAITLIVGTTLGILAGLFGGWLDHAIMGTTDVLMAFPGLLMIMTVSAVMGPGLETVIIALSVRFWTSYARVTRGLVLALKEADFMVAAQVVGGTRRHVIRRHLLPNILSPLATLMPLEVGKVMLAEAGISFLGLGIQPPVSSWGLLVSEGRNFISSAWWLITFPGLALFATILSTNIVGNWLRLATDPIHRGRLGE